MSVYIFLGIVALIVHIAFCCAFKRCANGKGYEGDLYFVIPFLFGIVGFLWICALPDRAAAGEVLKKLNELSGQVNAMTAPSPAPQTAPQTPSKAAPQAEEGPAEILTPISLPDNSIRCPKCGRAQKATRSVCWNCGTKFK